VLHQIGNKQAKYGSGFKLSDKTFPL